MSHNESQDGIDCKPSPGAIATRSPNLIIQEYLLKHAAIFRELIELKIKVSLCNV